MANQIEVKATANKTRTLAQVVTVTHGVVSTSGSPVEIPPGESRAFWVEGTNAVLVTEVGHDPASVRDNAARVIDTSTRDTPVAEKKRK